MSNQYHLSAVHEIANKVDRLVMKEANRARFTNGIVRLCKMAEDYARDQAGYIKKYERVKKRAANISLAGGTGSVDELCPPPKGWIRTSCEDNVMHKRQPEELTVFMQLLGLALYNEFTPQFV